MELRRARSSPVTGANRSIGAARRVGLLTSRLAPGRYEFTRGGFPRQTAPATPYWTIGKNGIATANNPNDAGLGVTQYRSHDAGAFLVSFDIVAGRATYVGNLHFIWDEATQSGQVVVRNEAQRDLQLLRERLPQIRTDHIRVA